MLKNIFHQTLVIAIFFSLYSCSKEGNQSNTATTTTTTTTPDGFNFGEDGGAVNTKADSSNFAVETNKASIFASKTYIVVNGGVSVLSMQFTVPSLTIDSFSFDKNTLSGWYYNTSNKVASGSSLVITKIDSNKAIGRFDIILANTKKVYGTFNVPIK